MITGTKAATKWYSEDGITKAKEPKELYVVNGLTHADLYNHVDKARKKLVEFFLGRAWLSFRRDVYIVIKLCLLIKLFV
jgi:fermentation-respiration switch protein FrsA (DUF1100 family)